MLKEFFKDPRALFYAVSVHVLLLALLVMSLKWNGKPAPLQGSGAIVQAVVVDEAKLRAEQERKRQEAQRRRDEEERQRQAALEQQRAEEQRKREAQQRQQQSAEQQRQAKLKAAKEAGDRKLAEQQAQRKLAEGRRKAAEDKRKAAAQRKADEAHNLEMMRQQMVQEEADRAAQAKAEQRQRELASLREQYSYAIAQKVERNWIKPPAVAQGASCKVRVKQIPGGDVVSVDASACIGDPSYRRSVEAAVFRASPLPQPPDAALFDRDIVFYFEPKQ